MNLKMRQFVSRSLTFGCASIAAVSCSALFAAPSPDDEVSQAAEKTLFEKLDRNADGKITADEVSDSQMPFFRRSLRVADHNKDGDLTLEEFQASVSEAPTVTSEVQSNQGRRGRFANAGRPGLADMLKRSDRNGDGQLTADEIPQALRSRFEEILDRAGQSSLSIERVQQMAGQFARQPGDLSRRSPAAGSKSRPVTSVDMTPERRETSASEQMSPQDIVARLIRSFDRADVNGDQGLDREELIRALQMAERGARAR
ncbi:MAG: hypothetical protein R3C20_05155 [Planctomycetaceae bacterium]